MRVLVTGASGFIGGHVAARLAGMGHEIVATGRERERLTPLASSGCRLEAANLAADPIDPLARGCHAVVHCAARASPWGTRDEFWQDNVVATERLIAAAGRAGVRRFVHVSSPSIYFRHRDQEMITEAFTPPAPWPTCYAETKWTAEERVRAAPELGPVILRPRAVFGPGDRAIVPRLLAAAARGVFPLPRSGVAWVDVTYIDNAVDAIVLALEASAAIERRAFNVTNAEPIQVRDLVTRLFAALGVRARLVAVPRAVAFAAANVSESVARLRRDRREPRLTRYGIGLLSYTQTLSLAAARAELGYSPAVPIDEGLARYAAWSRRR
jgi:nucleoside-diphosphate-sugar epimerase